MTLLEIARGYVAKGFSVIPIRPDASKRPALNTWKEFQRRRPSDDELVEWFSSGEMGIAIICGAISGGLEVLDFDDPSVWEDWLAKAPPAVRRLPRVRTPSGGIHLYMEGMPEVLGNRKFCFHNDKSVIETRGEGGYVLAPGSPASCHITGRTYEWER